MKTIPAFALLALAALPAVPTAAQTNATATSSLAYSGNAGWLDPRAGDGTHGVVLGQCVCTGFLYSASGGWINLGNGAPLNGVNYTNTSGADSGVNHLPNGQLRGLAWGASLGWINFEGQGNPRIDPATRQLLGHAWSASTGWISLSTPAGGIFVTDSDTDDDGLPDDWEAKYTTLPTLTASGDADDDGQADAEEYAADTDPVAWNPGPAISLTFHAGTMALTWSSSPLRNYRVQTTSNLQHWEYANFIHSADNPLLTPGSAGATTTRGVQIPAGQRMFFRIVALKPPAAP